MDERELHIVPVVLGTGLRLLDADLDLAEKEAIELTPVRPARPRRPGSGS